MNAQENKQFLANAQNTLEEYFNSRGYAGGEIRRGFSELYTMYRPELPLWLAKLYDSKIGGFYYSNSARDNEQFLPDIESTNQATNFLVNSGMIKSCDMLPEKMKREIEGFTKSLLDPDDGYFYHPQWGKNICDSRRGRDHRWALQLADKFRYTYDYPTAQERLAAATSAGEKSKVLPEQFLSEQAFIKYLESFDWVNDSYYAGNTIAAQSTEIITAGFAEICAEYLNKYQNPKNGFWSELSDMHTGINGFFKITSFYRNAGIGIKMAHTAARSIMACMISDEIGTTVCHLYNVYNAMDAILCSLRESGSTEDLAFADEIQDELLKLAPKALACARRKTEVFMKNDGAFSYLREITSSKSQDAPVALPNTPESDINASCICTSGLVNAICRSFGCESVKIPLYTSYDYERFLSALK